jgi:hypothetical protein
MTMVIGPVVREGGGGPISMIVTGNQADNFVSAPYEQFNSGSSLLK